MNDYEDSLSGFRQDIWDIETDYYKWSKSETATDYGKRKADNERKKRARERQKEHEQKKQAAYDQMINEASLRHANPGLTELYEQYQVMLRLLGGQNDA